MPLEMTEAGEADMDRLMEILFDAFYDPFEPYIEILCPGGNTPAGRNAAKARMLKDLEEDPDSIVWLKVADTETKEIISIAKWYVFKEDPYTKWEEEPFKVDWHENEDDREHAQETVGGLLERRVRETRGGPHLLLDILCTDPKHQRRGAGGLMVKWGTDKADELGVGSFVESSYVAQPLYEKHGFYVTDHVQLPVSEKFKDRPTIRYMQMKRDIPKKVAEKAL